MKFGGQHRAGDAARAVLPIPQEDKGVVGGLNQCQEAGEYGGIDITLQRFTCLHVGACHKDSALCCLPEKCLKAAALVRVGFQGSEPTRRVCKHQNASMRAGVAFIRLGWCAKGSSASDGEILAGLLMLLWIKMSFNQHVHLALP